MKKRLLDILTTLALVVPLLAVSTAAFAATTISADFARGLSVGRREGVDRRHRHATHHAVRGLAQHGRSTSEGYDFRKTGISSAKGNEYHYALDADMPGVDQRGAIGCG